MPLIGLNPRLLAAMLVLHMLCAANSFGAPAPQAPLHRLEEFEMSGLATALSALSEISPGRQVRLRVSPDSVFEGRLLYADRGGVRLGDAWKDTMVPVERITGVWEWTAGSSRSAALPGIIGAAALGTAAGITAARDWDLHARSEDGNFGTVVLSTVFFGALGYALGTVAGRVLVGHENRWEQRYPVTGADGR